MDGKVPVLARSSGWLVGEERGFLARDGKGISPCLVCPDFLQGMWPWELLVEPLEVQRALGMEQAAGRMLPFGATSAAPARRAWELGLQQGWGWAMLHPTGAPSSGI